MLWSHVRNATLERGKTWLRIRIPLYGEMLGFAGIPSMKYEGDDLVFTWGMSPKSPPENIQKMPLNPLFPQKKLRKEDPE